MIILDNKKAHQILADRGLIAVNKEILTMSNIALNESTVQVFTMDSIADYESFVLTSKNFAEEIQALCTAMLSAGEFNAQKLADIVQKLTSMHLEVCETEQNLMNAGFQGVMS